MRIKKLVSRTSKVIGLFFLFVVVSVLNFSSSNKKEQSSESDLFSFSWNTKTTYADDAGDAGSSAACSSGHGSCGSADSSSSCASGTGDGGCFIAGTLVDTPKGAVPIEDIKLNDEVYSYWERECIVTKVTKVLHHDGINSAFNNYDKDPLVEVTLDDSSTVKVTANHPFFIPEHKKYMQVRDLEINAKILTHRLSEKSIANETQLALAHNDYIQSQEQEIETTILSHELSEKSILRKIQLNNQPVVYNIETNHESHNYFADGVLVHNGGGDGGGK